MPAQLICKGLILSDLVLRDAGTGKISLINCFTNINALTFPFQAPPFFITALVSGVDALRGKSLQFKVSIKERNSDVHVLEVSGQIIAQGTGDPDEVGEMVWSIPSLIFPQVGVYDAVLTVDGQELGVRSLLVRAVTGAQVQLK
jgi:hypothetical protein